MEKEKDHDKHAAMVARLDARGAEREAGRERRKMEAQKGASEAENVKEFIAEFEEMRLALMGEIDGSSQVRKDSLETLFADLGSRVQELQQRVAQAVHFLPPYEQRALRQTINDLSDHLVKTKATVMPRKKFAFRRRKAKTKPKQQVEQSTADKGTHELLAASLQLKDFSNSVDSTWYKAPGSVGDKDLWLSGLKACTVSVCDGCRGARIDDVQDCTIMFGPVSGSVHIEKAQNCTFVLSSRQVRIHEAVDCRFFVHVRSGPIIEDCKGCRFAPYSLRYPELEQQMNEAGFGDEEGNMWDDVKDFKWLRNEQSPNWSIIPEDQRKTFAPVVSEPAKIS